MSNNNLPTLPKPHRAAVYANSQNTHAVAEGYEMGGYEKEPAYYTEAQMKAYALATIDAHLSAQAKVRVSDSLVRYDHCEDAETGNDVGIIPCPTGRFVLLSDIQESFAARLSQGAQGEASKPHSYRWRRHGRDEWHWAEWIPISDDEVSEMRNRGWDVEVLYTHPSECAAMPDSPARYRCHQFGYMVADEAGAWVKLSDVQAMPNGLTLAVIGRKHFGNPIPKAWYAAAREILTAAPQPTEGARVVDGARSAARKIRGSIIRRLEDFHESFPAHWCGYLDDALGAAEVIADELEKLAAPTLAGKEGA